MDNKINIVIGSWGSYNECNERALGSKWFTLNDYENWSEIEKELTNQGFELKGIDEELFIQDIEGIPTNSINWDYINPQNLFETIKKSGILDNDYKYELMLAYTEIETLSDWINLVESKESDWDDDICLHSNQTILDVAYDIVEECFDLEEPLDNYFDYERFADDLTYDGYYTTSYGVLELR